MQQLYCFSNRLTNLPPLPENSDTLECQLNFLSMASCPAMAGYSTGNYAQGNPMVSMSPELPVWPGKNDILGFVETVNRETYTLNCGQ